MTQELKDQIEAAFDFRGHVTVTLASGELVKGYLFNRQFAGPLLKEEPFVELFLEGTAAHRKLAIAEIAAVVLTGKDFAAGNSYEDYLKKKAAQEGKK